MEYLRIYVAYLLASVAFCQIPNVYEFCSALMSDRASRETFSCSLETCQGRPGKRGPRGDLGPPGPKGQRGEQGTCEDLKETQAAFEASVMKRIDLIPKLSYCSLGMENGDIPDESITASSSHDHRFLPFYGRLNQKEYWIEAAKASSLGAWCPSSNSGQWIQVDLGTRRTVAGVITQGRPKNRWEIQGWVKTFKISCGDADNLQHIQQNGSDKVFVGNSDEETKVVNKFPSVVNCRIVRLYPLTWNTVSPWVRPCLRMEILKGECFDLY